MPRRDHDTGFRFAPHETMPVRPARRWGLWALGTSIVAALVAAGAYVYQNPLSAPEWLQKAEVLPKPAPTVVFKWRDKAGAWHVTDAPPGDYEILMTIRDELAGQSMEIREPFTVVPPLAATATAFAPAASQR